MEYVQCMNNYLLLLLVKVGDGLLNYKYHHMVTRLTST